VALPDTFSIGEAAAILCISPPTLRAWEQRYHILEPGRTASNHRRYTLADLRLLARLKLAAAGTGRSLKRAAVDAMLDLDGHGADHPGDIAQNHQPVWRFIADQLADPILILNERGRTVDVNLEVARLFGADRGSLLNRPFATLAERPDEVRAARIAASPLRQRLGWAVRLRTAGPDAVFSFDCRPVRYGQDRLLVLVGRASPAQVSVG
jgi:PAS domain S-box-containing protein